MLGRTACSVVVWYSGHGEVRPGHYVLYCAVLYCAVLYCTVLVYLSLHMLATCVLLGAWHCLC